MKEEIVEQKAFNAVQEVVYDDIERNYLTDFMSILNNKGLELLEVSLERICHADATILAVAFANQRTERRASV